MAHPRKARLPPLAAYPDKQVRATVSKVHWDACLDAWIFLCRVYLTLSLEEFQNYIEDEEVVVPFLLSYSAENAKDPELFTKLLESKSCKLHDTVLFLSHRALLEVSEPPIHLMTWAFLADLSNIYRYRDVARKLLSNIWSCRNDTILESLQSAKDAIIRQNEDVLKRAVKRNSKLDEGLLSQLSHLSRMLPPVGEFLMTGTDLIDSLTSIYIKFESSTASKTLVLVYICLTSLLHLNKPNVSLLIDQLYNIEASVKTQKGANANVEPLAVALISDTPFLSKISKGLPTADANRAKNILVSLDRLRRPPKPRPQKHARRKIQKGKARTPDELGHGSFTGDIDAHRINLITAVQDVFPDFGSAFILRLLDHYGDNQETVIAHVLEDDLPEVILGINRSEDLPSNLNTLEHGYCFSDDQSQTPQSSANSLAVKTPPERRNVYDNDAFDSRDVDPSKIHFGRKDQDVSADVLLADRTRDQRSHNAQKAAILSALASFDPDDDERDDTYDVADVGGTIDSARPGDDAELDDMRERNEEALFMAYRTSQTVFKRDAATRRGAARKALRSEIGMTDEAIEGWAVMVSREPGRLRTLEAKYAAFAGQQRELSSSKWKAENETEESDGGESERPRGRASLRGRARNGRERGRGRGGTNVAGRSEDKATQIARDRKEANKGSRANHNRRDQRAKKMARGGPPG